jgi:hypothetical protein
MRFWRRRRPARAVKPAYHTRLRLERLEDRCVPSIDFVTNLSGSASVSGSLPYWVANAAKGDTIQFAANLNGGTITLAKTLDINTNFTIDGAGKGITVNGGGNRVFQIEASNMVVLNALTITGGTAPSFSGGGGIHNLGSLTLSNSSVTGNTALDGGGIFNDTTGTMTMSDDTVKNNTGTGAGGGGIANTGTMTIINCTIAANKAVSGGGIANNSVLLMADSTVASNTVAGGDGGGIITASAGGAQLSLLNTIVYNPNSGAVTKNEVLGTITQAQGDLFGPGPVVVAPGGDHGSSKFGFNPLLGPLQNNGGPTATMALLPGSPAIGAGVSTSLIPGLSVPTTDQRGAPRPAGSIDMGAYQVLPPTFNAPWQALGGSVTQLTAATDPNGDLEVFGIGLDHAVWVNVQTGPNGAFGGWCSLAGYVKQINVATNADGTLELFTIGAADGAWFKQQYKNGGGLSWSGWQSAGGYVRQLDSARDGHDNVELFAIGYDHGVWVNSQTSPEGAFGGWSSLGGYVQQITVGANSNGALQVFGIGADNAAYFCEQQAGSLSWSSWQSLGGYAKQLKVGRDLNNDLELFAIGADNGVWVISQTAPAGGFGGWSSLGGSVSQITVGTGNNGDLFVFGIGVDHSAYYRKQDSPTNLSYDGWFSLGGYAGQLTTANQANKDLDLFAISRGNAATWFRDVNV